MKKIKTFEDACKALGYATALPGVADLPEKHQKAMVAHYKLVIIVEALNEGWTPDWSTRGETKNWPCFVVEASEKCKSGSGLSYSDFDYTYAFTHVGSRLAYKTWELAKYAAKQFNELYKDYFLIN